MIPDPYVGAAKLVGIGILVLAVLGAIGRWRYVEGELTDARGEVARLEEDAAARAKNEELVAAVTKRWREKDEKRSVGVTAARKGVYDARKEIPKECIPAFSGIQRALDGVRELREDGGAPTPRPNVLPRSRTSRIG